MDDAINKNAVGTDADIVGYGVIAFEDDVDIDGNILPCFYITTYIDSCRITESDT